MDLNFWGLLLSQSGGRQVSYPKTNDDQDMLDADRRILAFTTESKLYFAFHYFRLQEIQIII